MKTITDIKPQTKNNKRVSIYLDGAYYCGMELFTVMKYRLKVGNTYTEEEIINIQITEEKNSAFDYALNVLSKSVKTEKEIRLKLSKRGYLEEIIEETIIKLKSYGYVNDEEYATRYVNTYSKNKGKRLLKNELKIKGVDDSVLKEVDNIVDNEIETAIKIAEKYVKNKPNDIKTLQKCYKYLLSKGFTYEDSKSASEKVLNLQTEY